MLLQNIIQTTYRLKLIVNKCAIKERLRSKKKKKEGSLLSAFLKSAIYVFRVGEKGSNCECGLVSSITKIWFTQAS